MRGPGSRNDNATEVMPGCTMRAMEALAFGDALDISLESHSSRNWLAVIERDRGAVGLNHARDALDFSPQKRHFKFRMRIDDSAANVRRWRKNGRLLEWREPFSIRHVPKTFEQEAPENFVLIETRIHDADFTNPGL